MCWGGFLCDRVKGQRSSLAILGPSSSTWPFPTSMLWGRAMTHSGISVSQQPAASGTRHLKTHSGSTTSASFWRYMYLGWHCSCTCTVPACMMQTSQRSWVQFQVAAWVFLFQQAFWYRWSDAICGGLVQFGCYQHRNMYEYTCRVLAIQLRVLIVSGNSPLSTSLNLTLMYP